MPAKTPWLPLFALVFLGLGMSLVAQRCQRPPSLPWHTDYPAAMTAAAATEQPVLVYLTMRGCVHCERLERDSLADAGVRALLGQHTLLKVRLDAPLDAATRRFDLGGAPALLVLDARGEIVDSVMGYRDAGQVRAFLERAGSRQK